MSEAIQEIQTFLGIVWRNILIGSPADIISWFEDRGLLDQRDCLLERYCVAFERERSSKTVMVLDLLGERCYEGVYNKELSVLYIVGRHTVNRYQFRVNYKISPQDVSQVKNLTVVIVEQDKSYLRSSVLWCTLLPFSFLVHKPLRLYSNLVDYFTDYLPHRVLINYKWFYRLWKIWRSWHPEIPYVDISDEEMDARLIARFNRPYITSNKKYSFTKDMFYE
jgi:hypothetical protein